MAIIHTITATYPTALIPLFPFPLIIRHIHPHLIPLFLNIDKNITFLKLETVVKHYQLNLKNLAQVL